MSQLPKEWEAIADAFAATGNYSAEQSVRNAVERCYALANKPVRKLTDAEIDAINEKHFPYSNWREAERAACRDAITAHQRKQQEPETVTFRAARNKDTGAVDMLKAVLPLGGNAEWEWLEPAQTIEVKLP